MTEEVEPTKEQRREQLDSWCEPKDYVCFNIITNAIKAEIAYADNLEKEAKELNIRLVRAKELLTKYYVEIEGWRQFEADCEEDRN